ncbi:hydrogenase formation protein HypD [Caulobacter sp. S45]|uniref:hydrogenase formation protein HypD n=1 Tax=Caulobacter sp. S45 TaxID=1641861 RepID=UPI00131CEBC4|nr:hydrogenase formation protein HypD [Caulobacter sp. S45]
MRFMHEFRDGELGRGICTTIAEACRPGRNYVFMEVCGGHTHTIARYGLEALLPAQVRLVHGPGCPVCVLPTGRIDGAIALARDQGVILCTYGDMMRVPGSHRTSLIQAKAAGADVRMVLSTLRALEIAKENPDRQVVFLGIGFETTSPATAIALKMARREALANFSVLCDHVLTPPAIQAVLGEGGEALQGLIAPGHVSAVIGTRPYQAFADRGQAVYVAGFEPLDILQAVLMLIRQVNEGRPRVENGYARALTEDGNLRAQAAIAETMPDLRSFEWRGLGVLPQSALQIGEAFADFDAERRFALTYAPAPDAKSCACADVIRGRRRPEECKLFGSVCTPDDPIGSCMVSNEGACAAHWRYGRHRPQRGGEASAAPAAA